MKPAWIIVAALPVLLAGQPEAQVEKLVAEAGAKLSAGRFEEAAAGFDAALARQPDLPEALFGLGLACGQLGRNKEAQRALRRYVELRPASAEGHAALGTILASAGDRGAARPELEQALKLDSGSLQTARMLAKLELADFNAAAAKAVLAPFAVSGGLDEEASVLLASAYAGAGDPRAAAALLGPRLEARPPPPPAEFALAATAAWQAGDTGAAERACALGMRRYLNSDEIEQRCVRIVSTGFVRNLEARMAGEGADAAGLIMLGRLLTDAAETIGSPVRARGLKALERAAALKPSDPSALYNLGRCLRVLARPEAALSPLRRALAARPDPELQTLIRTQVALCEQARENYAAAATEFRRAWELNRGLARHLPQEGFRFYTFLTSSDQQSQAGPVLDEVLRWDPTFLPGRMERARSLSVAGRLTEAAADAEIVARHTDPADRQLLRAAHILLFQLCTKLGRGEEAARHREWLKQER